MKPDTPSRIRHEMSSGISDHEALSKLSELTEFLGRVKDSARLRAKDEGGVTFLHTRTGTIFGRFIKRLTVSWSAAVEQRRLARQLIENVISKIGGTDQEISKLKQEILNNTLKINTAAEFDIAKLRTELSSLKNLAQSASHNDKSLAKHQTNKELVKNFPNDVNDYENSLVVTDSTESVNASESEEYLIPADEQGRSQINQQAAQSTDAEIVQSLLKPDSVPTLEKNEETESAPAERTRFGCFEIKENLSFSDKHQINAYQADAYITPAKEKNIQFAQGSAKYEPDSKRENSIHSFKGTHTFHDEKRDISVLQLLPINSENSVAFSGMNPEEKVLYLNKLHQRYKDALNHPAIHNAKSIAIEPLRNGQTLVHEKECKVLAKAVTEFQLKHPAVKIQVVLSRTQEVNHFQAALLN